MNTEQYTGCLIMFNGQIAVVTGERSNYDGDFIYLQYIDGDEEFCVNAFDDELLEALPDPEYGILKRRENDVVFLYNDCEYMLGSHPYEPCLYIRKNGEIFRTLHNAFDTYDLPEIFAKGEILTGADGKEYNGESFRRVIAAAIDSDRTEMDFTFAAGLLQN